MRTSIDSMPVTYAERIADSNSAILKILEIGQSQKAKFKGALCMDVNTDNRNEPDYVDMYPPTDKFANPAKLVCAQCIHTEECFRFSIENREKGGVWGGSTANEREKIFKAHEKYLKENEGEPTMSLISFAIDNRDEYVKAPDPEGPWVSPASYKYANNKKPKSKPKKEIKY